MIAGVEINNGSCEHDHALLGVVCYPKARIDTFYLYAKFDHSGFSRSRESWWASKFKVGHVTPTTPFKGSFVTFVLERDITYMCTIFDDCSLSRSRDMIGAHQNLNGSRDLTTPLSWMVCHPWASIWYDQPIYQIWSLYLHQYVDMTSDTKCRKWGGFG